MSKIKIGALLKTVIPLLVYETEEEDNEPALRSAVTDLTSRSARSHAKYFSKILKCEVWSSKPNDVFFVLGQVKEKHLLKVLHGNRVGWIYDFSWLKLEKVVMQ